MTQPIKQQKVLSSKKELKELIETEDTETINNSYPFGDTVLLPYERWVLNIFCPIIPPLKT